MDKNVIEEYIVRNMNRNARYLLLSGKQNNGPGGPMFPKGKYMNNVRWACKLEKQAIAALGTKCGYDEPKAPAGMSGMFFNLDIDWDEPDIYTAMHSWANEINEFAMQNVGKTDVKYDNPQVRNWVNLVRPDITKIGCADITCVENGLNKYRAYCLVDKPPLNLGQVMYEAGNGGCKYGESCAAGFKCDKYGFCKEEPKPKP
ncbi:SCP-like protein [Ancylostoma duodenale]|uniref:SCP-like protein n=1 Tax=Ancylostoma duodenale TaxID=51022 RepID=A0A0C2D0F4_9BILA|nr:SCP-like protein [Ancylostoma duodenale]